MLARGKPIRKLSAKPVNVERPAPARPLRVLVLSHLHPRLSRGGAEIASYQMFAEMRTNPDVKVFFAAGSAGKLQVPPGVHIMQPFGDDEYILAHSEYDHWSLGIQSASFAIEFRELVAELRPDVVHFHHVANLGVEALLLVAQAAPQARIILTFHEFQAICHHYGQMVKRPGLELCAAATLQECVKCFPDRTENDFFLRKIYIQRFLSLVHHFIAPSGFLAKRYVEWGIRPELISVVENGQPAPGPVLTVEPDPDCLMFGFFGQMSELKGVHILLDAAAALQRLGVAEQQLRIVIHGDPSNQPPEHRQAVVAKMTGSCALVHFAGPYQHDMVQRLMQGCHAILVPSIWWENSPLVIQEAFAARRPVICSDIGGMAEKARDGVDGFHFRAGDSLALARLLQRLVETPTLLAQARLAIKPPTGLADTVRETLRIYRQQTKDALA